jgi:hypothetical protein
MKPRASLIPILCLFPFCLTAASTPQPPSTASQPAATQTASPTLNEALAALKAMTQASNDSALQARIPDLSKKPESSSDAPLGDGVCYRFGIASWEIRLYNRSWNVRVMTPSNGTWLYFGNFQKSPNTPWQAIETSRRGEASRGG